MSEERRNKIIKVIDGEVILEERTEKEVETIRYTDCICFGCPNGVYCDRVYYDSDSRNNYYIDSYDYILDAIESVDENGYWDYCTVTGCKNFNKKLPKSKTKTYIKG